MDRRLQAKKFSKKQRKPLTGPKPSDLAREIGAQQQQKVAGNGGGATGEEEVEEDVHDLDSSDEEEEGEDGAASSSWSADEVVGYDRQQVRQAVDKCREYLKDKDVESWPRTEAEFVKQLKDACTLQVTIDEGSALYFLLIERVVSWRHPSTPLKHATMPKDEKLLKAWLTELMSEAHMKGDSVLTWDSDELARLQLRVAPVARYPRFQFVLRVATFALDAYVTGQFRSVPGTLGGLVALMRERKWLEVDIVVPPEEALAELSLLGSLSIGSKGALTYHEDSVRTGKSPVAEEELFSWSNILAMLLFGFILYAYFFM